MINPHRLSFHFQAPHVNEEVSVANQIKVPLFVHPVKWVAASTRPLPTHVHTHFLTPSPLSLHCVFKGCSGPKGDASIICTRTRRCCCATTRYRRPSASTRTPAAMTTVMMMMMTMRRMKRGQQERRERSWIKLFTPNPPTARGILLHIVIIYSLLNLFFCKYM